MGKPLTMVRGEYYFVARCPRTDEILDAIPDPHRGERTTTGEWVVACSECDSHHTLDLSQIRSEQVP